MIRRTALRTRAYLAIVICLGILGTNSKDFRGHVEGFDGFWDILRLEQP